MDNFALQQIINRILVLKCRYRGSFPSDDFPTLDNDFFAIINTQPSKRQGEHWILFANFQQNCVLQTLLVVKSSFPKQQYEHMTPETLQSHPSVCGFYTIYAAFHLFKFRQEINAVHDVNVLSFRCNYM